MPALMALGTGVIGLTLASERIWLTAGWDGIDNVIAERIGNLWGRRVMGVIPEQSAGAAG